MIDNICEKMPESDESCMIAYVATGTASYVDHNAQYDKQAYREDFNH